MGNITNEKFTMQSVPCECLIDVTHDETGAEKRTLKIKEIHGTVYTYAYEAKEGLVRIDPETGGVISKNVLGELLSIKPADTNGLMNFFRKNGFFTPLSSSSYSAFDFEDLFCVLKRIQETLHLMNMTQGSYIQYKKMLHVISWLVLSDRITLCAVEGEHPQLETCIHGYKDELLRISRESYTVTPFDPAAYESNQSEVTVYDSIINGQTSVSMSDYESRIAGAQMFGDYEQSDILLSKYAAATLFLYHQDCAPERRKVIDYYYHVTSEIGEIVRKGGGVVFDCEDSEFEGRFSKHLREATLDVARIIIKEELDYAINAIYPSYDIQTMSASWKIPDLYSALFFSIFYMKPNIEIYRECENPNCNCYFLVATTNSKKKYCCDECSNAMQQRKYRKRKKKASAEADAIKES